MVIQTGNDPQPVAVAFAKFTAVIVPACSTHHIHVGHPATLAQQILAIVVIAVLTGRQLHGLHTGRWVQKWFSRQPRSARCWRLIAFGLLLGRNAAATQVNLHAFWGPPGLSLSLLPVIGAAWSARSFHSIGRGEQHHIPRAAEGTRPGANGAAEAWRSARFLVTVLYLATNLVYLTTLPLQGDAVGAALQRPVASSFATQRPGRHRGDGGHARPGPAR